MLPTPNTTGRRQEMKWGKVFFFVKSGKWGCFVKKWTFPRRRVHYVQYQYFLFYILFIWERVRTHPTEHPCLGACTIGLLLLLRLLQPLFDSNDQRWLCSYAQPVWQSTVRGNSVIVSLTASSVIMSKGSPYSIRAKFHYRDTDTGPTRTRTRTFFVAKLRWVRAGPFRRVRVVEFSSYRA